jgi:formylglycine-generating enzyme required for sulfatase activity
LITKAWLFLKAQIVSTAGISLLLVGVTVLAAWKFGHFAGRRPVPVQPGPRAGVPITSPKFTNTIGMKFVRIEAGSFLMGSASSEPDHDEFDGPRHEVTLTKAFYLGAHHVTVKQFTAFVNDTGYMTDAEKAGGGFELRGDGSGYAFVNRVAWHHPGFAQGPDYPVILISWQDATAFCRWLSKKEGRHYRLPTEAEWEYACRAGATTLYPWGDDPDDGKRFANVCDKDFKTQFPEWPDAIFHFSDGYAWTSPVGSFDPNALGLYDMIGNAWQWCSDADAAYGSAAATDPTGPTPTGTSKRIRRGGAFDVVPRSCRCSHRATAAPDLHNADVGFRVAMN